jgi:cytochrome c oxidase subunit II
MRIIFCMLILLCGLVLPSIATEDVVQGMAEPWQTYFQGAATPVMERLRGLHDYILVIITIITVFVTALLGYVCVRFHHKRNSNPSKTTHNTLLEIAWITIPALILVSIFVPSLKLHYYMDKTHNPDLTLKVTGFQWYWGYSYPDNGVDEYLSNIKAKGELKAGEPNLLAVDNPLVVPVGANVRVLLTGADVIHSFAMPAFGVKTDTIPGRLNETWFQATKTGIYYGQCSELCGVRHGFMPIEIRVVEKDVFEKWVERAKEGNFALDGINIPTDNKVASNGELEKTKIK